MRTLLRFGERYGDERGSAVIYVALVLFLLLGVAALAVDTGYNRVVRNQLQNAADAAALDACNFFYRDVNPLPLPPDPCPDFSRASARAVNAIPINSADNNPLQTGTIWVGWWDIVRPLSPDQWAGAPSTPTCTPPTQMYGPAVRVTILKASGQNSGAMPTFFGKIFGTSTIDVDASATAVAASPGSARTSALPLPVAIAQEMANTWPLGVTFTIGSTYHYPNSLAGEWTSFLEQHNSTTYIRDLLEFGNPAAVSVGDEIWIESGVHNTLYANPNQPSVNNLYAGDDVVLPIVSGVMRDNTHEWKEVVGFIGFHVDYAVGGSTKTIVGHFTTAPIYGGNPVGPHFGPIDRCRLAR